MHLTDRGRRSALPLGELHILLLWSSVILAQESGLALTAYWPFDDGYDSVVNNELYKGTLQSAVCSPASLTRMEIMREETELSNSIAVPSPATAPTWILRMNSSLTGTKQSQSRAGIDTWISAEMVRTS